MSWPFTNLKSNEAKPCRKGSALIYSLFLMIIMLAMVSLGVDFGRVQLIKTQLQRTADAAARGILQEYANYGSSVANAYGPYLTYSAYNPVDANSGVAATASIVWGSWNASTKTFVPGGSTPMAVQVTMSRTVQTGNPVPLTFPLLNGLAAMRKTCDVWATAVAVLQPSQTITSTVPGTADLWLSGMPAGSNAGCWDSPANASPTLAMTVVPGTIVTFGATGSTSYSGVVPIFGADGASYNTTHMQGSPDGNYNGLQNGIQTLTAPQNALIGAFLTNSAPNTQTPPATGLSYSTASENQSSYTSLQLQQPFFIGTGQTAGGITQSFVVPAGATRLYLGVFDGYLNYDNPGALSVTTTQQPQVYLVK